MKFKSNIFIPIALFIALLSMGCSNTIPENTITLSVKMKSGSQSVDMNKYYQLVAGDSIMITRMDFYVSNFTAYESGAMKEPASSIGLFSLGNSSNSLTFKSKNIPLKMDSFRFLVGLDEASNNSNPNSFTNDNPLSGAKNMYWTEWTKYRYIVFEGKIKSAGLESNFAYHTGQTYKNYTSIHSPITLMEGNVNNHNLTLNISLIFNPISGNNILYHSGELQTHAGASEAALTTKFAENFSRAFSLE